MENNEWLAQEFSRLCGQFAWTNLKTKPLKEWIIQKPLENESLAA